MMVQDGVLNKNKTMDNVQKCIKFIYYILFVDAGTGENCKENRDS
jgi:hypothetical protein